MCKRTYQQFLLSAIVLILGLSVTTLGWQASAQGLPPGIAVEVLADYGSPGIPGVAKVVLKRFTIQPGAKIENLPIKTTNYCRVVSGAVTAVMADGSTLILGPGSRWVEPKGLVYKVLRNDGDVPFVDEFIEVTHTK